MEEQKATRYGLAGRLRAVIGRYKEAPGCTQETFAKAAGEATGTISNLFCPAIQLRALASLCGRR